MSKEFEKKAVMTLEGDITPLLQALGQAQDKIKEFEKQAAKSGAGHGGRGRANSVGGIFSGAGGGGAAGTARAFFGGWMAAEGMEAAINSLTIGIRKHQLAQAKATGDLDKMALATIKVNQAQEQFVSSFPVLGASIARLMRVISSTEKLQEIMQIRAGQRSVTERQTSRGVLLADEIAILEATLKGVNAEGILGIRQSQELRNAEKDRKKVIEEQTAILKENNTVFSRWGLLNPRGPKTQSLEFIDAVRRVLEERESGKTPGPTGFGFGDYGADLSTHSSRLLKNILKQFEDSEKQVRDLHKTAQAEIDRANANMEEERRQKELRLIQLRFEEEKRIADFIRDKEYEILQVQLNNELANQEDAKGIFNGKLKLLELEEKYVMDKMQREKASYGEQRIVSRLFRQREESLYGERERALAKEREEEDKKRRDLQKRLNAHDNATTAAYVSMSGAVTNASAEQQTAKNTQELVKETRTTNRELRRLTQAQQAAHFGKQAVGFRRERLN